MIFISCSDLEEFNAYKYKSVLKQKTSVKINIENTEKPG